MFELPKLPYAYDALEPYIDAKTMEIHHTKHHATYVQKLNDALAKYPDLQKKNLTELISELDKIPEAIRKAVQNHGGGHFNHSAFWRMMRPAKETKGSAPTGFLLESIVKSFTGLDQFKEEFSKAAAGG